MALPRSELHALLRKYRSLSELRRQREDDAPPELRLLAREFPGALRELDALPLDELDRRMTLTLLAIAGGPTDELLEWMSRYHALMRAALAVKRRLAEVPRPNDADAAAIARAVSREIGSEIDAELVLEVAAPPRGRLNYVVFTRLAAAYGVDSSRLRRALFMDERS